MTISQTSHAISYWLPVAQPDGTTIQKLIFRFAHATIVHHIMSRLTYGEQCVYEVSRSTVESLPCTNGDSACISSAYA